MKRYSTRAIRAPGVRAFSVLALTMLLQAGVFAGLVVSPTTIDNGYVGPCDLTITGLDSPGQTVLVEEYVDADGSTTITGNDVLVRQYRLTDGQVTTLGGQRNVNVPGDEDVTVNSQILMRVVFRGQPDLTQINGLHLFRVSPVGGGFTPFTASLTVTQKDYGGSGISGTTGQAGAFVVFLAGGFDGEFAGATACDGTGAYSMKLPPGSYLPLASKDGFVYNAGGASNVTVSSGSFTTGQNLTLVAGARTISGKVRDAVTPANGVPAMFMHAVSQSGFVSLTYTDANGDYQVDAPAEGCELGFDEWQVATHGYMPTSVQNGSAGNVSGLNIDLTPIPSMIYGSLKTPGDVPLPYQPVDAMQFGGANTSQAVTDANGNFSLGADTGSWHLNSEPPGYVVQSRTVVVNTTGSAVQQNLVAIPVTAHLTGQVRDSSNNPVPFLEIIARDPLQSGGDEINAFATTDASGNFSLGVYGGGGMTTKLWTIQVLFSSNGPPAYISTSPQFNVQDGVDITGIVYQVYNVTAHLRGQVLDETDTPVGNISAYASHTTLNGVHTGSNVDGAGNFDLSVFAGTWNLGLSNITGLGLLPQNLQITVANGADQNGLVIRALHTTATISGTVKNASNQAVPGIRVYGTVVHGGQTYNTSSTTDGSGFYSLPVFSETWTVSLNSTDLAGQGFQPASNQNVFANTGNVTQNFVVQTTGGMAPEIAVEQPAGSGLADGGSKSFGNLPAGGSSNLVFTIKNLGTADLTGLLVTKDGANASDFTVDTTGMASTVAPSGSTTFSVTFAPSGLVSGSRTAAIHIANNDSDENPFDIGVSGLILSPTTDTDSDGLNDWAEYQYAALGFDWQVTQTALVNTLNSGANAAGLYTPSQVQAMNVGTPLLQRNPVTGMFTLTIGVQKSTNLIQFDPFPMSAPQTTINGSGQIEFQFTLPGNAAFLRLSSQ